MNRKPVVSKQTFSNTFRSSQQRCSLLKAVLKNLQYSLENTCVKVPYQWSCSPEDRLLQHMCFPVNIAEFLSRPILKNSCKLLLLYIVSKLRKWEMGKKAMTFFWNVQKQPFRGAPKDTSPKDFFKFHKKVFRKVCRHLKGYLEHLWTATFGDSDDKILLFNKNGPLESNRILFWKNTLTKSISYKQKNLSK